MKFFIQSFASVLFTAGLACAVAGPVSAQERSVVGFQDRPEIEIASVSIDRNENLACTVLPGGTKKTFAKGQYSYVWIPRPAEIAAADHLLKTNPGSAADAYAKCYDRYKLFGWDVYCLYRKADALARNGKKEEAIRELRKIVDYKVQNRRLNPERSDANRLMLRLCVDTGNYDLARERILKLAGEEDSDLASYAYALHGEMLRKQGRERDAANVFLQAFLMFPKTPLRREILSGLAASLRELKDPNAEKFEKILQKD